MKRPFLSVCIRKLCKVYFSTSSSKKQNNLLERYCFQNASKDKIIDTVYTNQTRKMRSILGTKSVDQVLLILGNAKDNLEIPEITASCQMIWKHVDKIIKQQLWAIYDDERSLWIQSNINSGAHELFFPIISSPEFSFLLRKVESNARIFTSSQLLIVTKALLNLFVPTHNDAVVALVSECIKRIPVFSIPELAELSVVNDRLKCSYHPILYRIIEEIQNRLEKGSDLCADVEDFKGLAVLVSNFAYFVSEAFLARLLSNFKELLQNHTAKELITYDRSILQCFETIHRFISQPDEQLSRLIVNYFRENMDNVSIWKLGRASFVMNKLTLMDKSLCSLFQKRAEKFFQRRMLLPADMVSVIQIVMNTTKNENLFKETVFSLDNSLPSFDALLLKQLVQTNFLQKINNGDIVHKFSQCVSERFGDVTKAVSCVQSLLSLYVRLRYRSKDTNTYLCKHLVYEVAFGQMGISPSIVSLVYQYFITCHGVTNIPPVVSEVFNRMIPQLPFIAICCILKEIDGHLSIVSHIRLKELMELSVKLKLSLLRRNEVKKLKDLNMLVSTLLRRFSRDKSALPPLSYFAELYETVAPTRKSSTVSLKCACLIFQKNRLFVPETLQAFGNALATYFDRNIFLLLSSYLQTCALVNFKPANVHDFEKYLNEMVHTVMDDEVWTVKPHLLVNILLVAWSLAVLQVFPTQFLSHIFSSKSMKILDEIHASDSCNKQLYEDKLLSLNRCVVLECPELRVPWFNEKFVQKGYESSNSSSEQTILQIVLENHLETIFGSLTYFKPNHYSPYLYHIDFECYLTKDKHLVAVPYWDKHKNGQRVAILLLKYHDFCSNANRITGPLVMKVRHLEIMGYKVVQVPYYMLQNRLGASTYFDNKSISYFLQKSILE